MPAAIALATVLAAAPALAQDQKGQAAAADAKKAQAPEPKDKTSVTHHTVRIEGQPISYTAKAGTLVLHDANDKAIAHVGDMLRQAMAENPYLHTLILGGYFDGGTDFSTAHYTISHLDPSGALNKRFHSRSSRAGTCCT